MTKVRVICIGEALVDKIINKSDNHFKNYLGGAPANVACALSKLGVSTAFVGCVGNDAYGHEFRKLFNKLKVNIDFLQNDEKYSTRVVKVIRDSTGDRSFSGFEYSEGNSFADEMLEKSFLKNNLDGLKKLFSETNYIVTGSNILASEKSAESLKFILEIAKDFDIKIVVDVNWRDIFWNNSNFVRNIDRSDKIKQIKRFLNNADILKLASEEAQLFFETHEPLEISQSLKSKPDVIITDASNPILWYIKGIKGLNQVINSEKVVDTTGAGDAFLAGLLSKFSNESKSLMDYATIQNYVNFASICGLLTCLGEGAIEQQPSGKLVYEFIENLGAEI